MPDSVNGGQWYARDIHTVLQVSQQCISSCWNTHRIDLENANLILQIKVQQRN